MPDNVRAAGFKTGGRKVPQRIYRRLLTEPVRVKRCGKSAPRCQQWQWQGKPHTEQGPIGRETFHAQAWKTAYRSGAPRSPGRSLERCGNAPPRGMAIQSRLRDGQNSAYRPPTDNALPDGNIGKGINFFGGWLPEISMVMEVTIEKPVNPLILLEELQRHRSVCCGTTRTQCCGDE